MKNKRAYILGSITAFFMVVCILDCKNALSGAANGLELCIKTVVPALFPFLFLTGVITRTLNEPLGIIFRPIGKLFKIPVGTESALIMGLLGGYPIGAQAVHNTYNVGLINKKEARRMISFCNNPGPAFIFGMAGCMFDSFIVPWVIWGIIIIGSFLTAKIQPVSSTALHKTISQNTGNALEASIKAIAKICSWVILFRVLITILQRWILWLLPPSFTIIITGLLELTNGCAALANAKDAVFRFCCICAFLSFGGICVTMQTLAVAEDLIGKNYFWGKLFQVLITIPLSYMAGCFLFSASITITGLFIIVLSLSFALFISYLLHKNNTGNV